MMETSLLIIEDDTEFASYLERGLTYEGYQVQVTTTAEAGFRHLAVCQPDLIILDVMLPGMDGMAACYRLQRSGYAIPILMLTARNGVDDRIAGLNAGAADYLGKPFAFDELLARLRALLRRHTPTTAIITFSDLELDTNLHLARRHGREIILSRTEYNLLAFLMAHPQKTLARSAILEQIWASVEQSNVLDVYIFRLRRKLGQPPLIHTVHGVGYILNA